MTVEHVEQPTEVHELPRLVTLRTLVLAVTIASLLSIGGAVALSFALIGQPEPGPQGPAGQRGAVGQQGPQGEPGDPGDASEVDEESVWSIIEGDSTRVTSVVEGNLDPAPADVASDLEDLSLKLDRLRSDVEDLCSDLSYADALSSEYLSCP